MRNLNVDTELVIDKIVLHGFPQKTLKGLKEAVEIELGLLIKERGLPAGVGSGGSYEHFPGGSISVKANLNVKTLASTISNHIYNGLSVPLSHQKYK